MRKGLQKYVILLDIWGFHGGAYNMELFQMLRDFYYYPVFQFTKVVAKFVANHYSQQNTKLKQEKC